MSTQGNRNNSANWSVSNLFALGGANANIQVFGDRIYAMGENQITCYPYIGTDVISELITTSNYTTGDHDLTSGGVVTPNVYTDGAGNLATVDQPLSMWKDGNKYYFSNSRIGSTTRGSYVHQYLEHKEKRFLDEIPLPTINLRTLDTIYFYSSLAKMSNLCDLYLKDINYLTPICIEYMVGDEELGLAGTLDRLYYNHITQEYEIWDFKTDKKFKTSNKYQKLNLLFTGSLL
jgi:hypothetical protein